MGYGGGCGVRSMCSTHCLMQGWRAADFSPNPGALAAFFNGLGQEIQTNKMTLHPPSGASKQVSGAGCT